MLRGTGALHWLTERLPVRGALAVRKQSVAGIFGLELRFGCGLAALPMRRLFELGRA